MGSFGCTWRCTRTRPSPPPPLPLPWWYHAGLAATALRCCLAASALSLASLVRRCAAAEREPDGQSSPIDGLRTRAAATQPGPVAAAVAALLAVALAAAAAEALHGGGARGGMAVLACGLACALVHHGLLASLPKTFTAGEALVAAHVRRPAPQLPLPLPLSLLPLTPRAPPAAARRAWRCCAC